MDPWDKYRVRPSLHAFDRIAQRGLTLSDLERMLREGERLAEGQNRYLVRHGAWEIPVQLRRCFMPSGRCTRGDGPERPEAPAGSTLP